MSGCASECACVCAAGCTCARASHRLARSSCGGARSTHSARNCARGMSLQLVSHGPAAGPRCRARKAKAAATVATATAAVAPLPLALAPSPAALAATSCLQIAGASGRATSRNAALRAPAAPSKDGGASGRGASVCSARSGVTLAALFALAQLPGFQGFWSEEALPGHRSPRVLSLEATARPSTSQSTQGRAHRASGRWEATPRGLVSRSKSKG